LQILSRDEHTISELGRHLMIAPATLVPVVDNLEREGLVHRGQDPRDRRRTPVSITEHGARVISRVPVLDKDDALVRSLEQMGPEKAERLLTLVRDLVAGMWEDDHPRSGRSMVDSLRASVREQLGCDQVAGQAQPVNLGSDGN
jgi:DNA-binding MarR family transcriptional regulator